MDGEADSSPVKFGGRGQGMLGALKDHRDGRRTIGRFHRRRDIGERRRRIEIDHVRPCFCKIRDARKGLVAAMYGYGVGACEEQDSGITTRLNRGLAAPARRRASDNGLAALVAEWARIGLVL